MAGFDLTSHENSGAREIAKGKFTHGSCMSFPSREALEQATPEAVARYRAQRICQLFGAGAAEKTAADLCCGIGMDAIALAGKFWKIYAIDVDAKAIESAKANAKIYGAQNIEFICADYRTIGLEKLGAGFVFADPSRRVAGRRVGGLGQTEPSTTELIEHIKKSGVPDFCIEASHTLAPEELPQECEKEFTSVGHEPNCISLWFGKLKRENYSVVCLPSGKRMEGNTTGGKIDAKESLLRYLFELEEGVVRLGMQKQLHDSLGKNKERAFPFNEKFFGTSQKFASEFFRNSFKVLSELPSKEGLAEKLAKLGAGKVVIRGKFADENAQLALKAEIESQLSGKRKLHVFFFGEEVLICLNMGLRGKGA